MREGRRVRGTEGGEEREKEREMYLNIFEERERERERAGGMDGGRDGERDWGKVEREIVLASTTIRKLMYSTPSILCSCTGLPVVCV